MKEKFVILFSGAVGSSKTPIAHYLSWKFNLPIFSNDSICSEINEEFDSFNEEEYIKRRDLRLKELVDKNISFIYDASIDRIWDYLGRQVDVLNYKKFIINLNLSKELLISLYKRKDYEESLKDVDKIFSEHNNFLEKYKNIINLNISDKEFGDRLELSYKEVEKWLNNF